MRKQLRTQIETSSSRWTEFSNKALWEEFQEDRSIGSNRNVYSNKIPGDGCVFDPNLYCNISTKVQTFYCGKLISDKTFTYRTQRVSLWFSCSHSAVGKRIISKKGSAYTIVTPAKTPLKHRKRNTFREVDTKATCPVLTNRYQQMNKIGILGGYSGSLHTPHTSPRHKSSMRSSNHGGEAGGGCYGLKFLSPPREDSYLGWGGVLFWTEVFKSSMRSSNRGGGIFWPRHTLIWIFWKDFSPIRSSSVSQITMCMETNER